MTAGDENHDTLTSAALILGMCLVLAFLVLVEPSNGLDQNYIRFYQDLGITTIILLLVLWAVGALSFEDDDVGSSPVSSGEARGLASYGWWPRAIAAVLLLIVFVAFAGNQQHSFIPIINPYDASHLYLPGQTLSTVHGSLATATRTGLYAGVFEDGCGYVFVLLITLLLLILLWKRFDEDAFSNTGYVIASIVISSILWGVTFASAHKLVYGLDTQAYTDAFIYGFLSQLANALVGAPVSILAHFGHNFIVVLGYSILFSIGGAAAFILYHRRCAA
jgi:hypothetical protein